MDEKTTNEKKENILLDDLGIIFLTGAIDSGTAENVCGRIIQMSLSNKYEQIQMIINSVGGSTAAGFAIIDMMEWSSIPVYTTGLGMIASMGLLIFMAGEKGHRIITPHTSILSHRFWSLEIGNHSQLLAIRKQHDLEHQRILNHYMKHTAVKSKEELESVLLRDVDTWLSPEEALNYGLADAIELRPKK